MRPLTVSTVDPAVVSALVLLAAVMHASWNALIKGAKDQVGSQMVIMAVGMAMAATLVPWVPPPAREAWPFIAVSVVAHTVYRCFLVWAYRHGDLSKVYPLARGSAPLLVALAASQLEGEVLRHWEAVGVLLVSCGIASLAFEGRRTPRDRHLPVVLALCTGLFVSSYTMIDGMGARRAGSVLGYAAWLFLFEGMPFVFGVAFLRRRRLVETWRASWRPGLVGGVISTAGYTIVIWAMTVGGIAHAVALRETSVIVAALIGVVLMKEAAGARRIAAAVLVVGGNLLLQLL